MDVYSITARALPDLYVIRHDANRWSCVREEDDKFARPAMSPGEAFANGVQKFWIKGERAFVVGSAIWSPVERKSRAGHVTKFKEPGRVKLHFVLARSGNAASDKVEKEIGPYATSERKVWFIEDSAFIAKTKAKVSPTVRKCFAANGYIV